MPKSKLSELVTNLLDKTNKRLIRWEMTSDDVTYQLAFPDYAIQVTRRRSYVDPTVMIVRASSETLTFILRIFDNKGKMVDESDDTEIGGELRALFLAAQRSARGAEKAYQSILDALSSSLTIESATYGINDQVLDVAPILRSKIVDGLIELAVNNDNLGGDPAPGIPKRLEVTYTHGGERKTVPVNENDILRLP